MLSDLARLGSDHRGLGARHAGGRQPVDRDKTDLRIETKSRSDSTVGTCRFAADLTSAHVNRAADPGPVGVVLNDK